MTPINLNPFARKAPPMAEAAGAAAQTDSTDPLILSSRIDEQAEVLREAAGLRIERVSVLGEGGELADSFLRASVAEAGPRADTLRALWLGLPETLTGFRDLLVSDSAALCAAFDAPAATLAELPQAILDDSVYIRVADIASLMGNTLGLLAAIREQSGWVLNAPAAADIAVNCTPLLGGRLGEGGLQHWRASLIAWDRLADENEADNSAALLQFFEPVVEALRRRAEESGFGPALPALDQLSRMLSAAAAAGSYAEAALALRWPAAALSATGASDSGRRRQHNEDAWLSWQLEQHSSIGASLSLAAVADGMGGHASGEVASSLALDLLRTQLAQTLLPPRTRQGEPAQLTAAIRNIVPGISRVLLDRAAMEQSMSGMGTTLVGFARLRLHSSLTPAGDLSIAGSSQAAAGAAACLFWCGDSRAYLLGPCGLARLSRDHSYVQELWDSGQVGDDEAFSHPQKNIITRCLGGGGADSEAELLAFDCGPGELLLLCSDGLNDALRDSEIWEVARTALAAKASHAELCAALIAAANAAGGPDNITVLVVNN